MRLPASRRALTLAFFTLFLIIILPRNTSPPPPSGAIIPFSRPQSPIMDTNVPLFTPPLRTAGRYVLDANSTRIKFKSINWYGGSDINFVPSGLDVRHRSAIAARIRSMGFNTVRLPFSSQLARDNPIVANEHLSANPDLLGKPAIEVIVAVVDALTSAGSGVILNDHVTQASWCDGFTLCDAAWTNDWIPFCPVRQSEAQWIERWERIMRPLKDNPRVIGVDLRNEPRGLWGTMWWGRWASAAERAAEALLRINPAWLIIIEGIGSANDLSGVASRPVRLSVPDRVVYSAHVFAWSGWGQWKQYSRANYEEFAAAMRRNWAYLLEGDVAPVWVAELGAGISGKDQGERNYWTNLMKFLAQLDVDWGYWAMNPRKPEGNVEETWKLVEDDWETVVEDYRMKGLRGLMGERPRQEKSIVEQVEEEMLEGDYSIAA